MTSAELRQSIFAHRPLSACLGAIQAHQLWLQLVGPHDALVESHFKALPLLRLAQRIQHDGQPAIAPELFTHTLPRTVV